MSARLSLNHGYFYDALSCKFLPPSDPKGRKRNLARLMNQTMERGEITNANAHQEKRLYIPSWAPIKSVVHISHWDIRSLTLTGEEREVQFVHTLTDSRPRGVQVFDTDYSDSLVFEAYLGNTAEYDLIQNRIRNIAQNFFEAFPSPEVVPLAQ